jgi:SAM-dependent methyltransferase
MTEAEILERMKKYPFYHSIQLTEQINTGGWEPIRNLVNMTLRNLRTLDLKGKRVLDIGCRDGIFCFEAEKLGAKEIIGIDNDPSLAMREFLIPFFNSKVQLVELNLMDLRPETHGKFDVVIFPGVLYHLRYPFWALKLVRDVIKDDGQLVLETAVYVDDNKLPLLFCPIGTESPYEPTSCTFYNTKAMMDTLYSLGLTVQRVEYLNNSPMHVRPPTHMREVVNAALGAAGKKPSPVIDRATFVCQMTPQVLDPHVVAYWDGTHRIHTKHHGHIEGEPLAELQARQKKAAKAGA